MRYFTAIALAAVFSSTSTSEKSEMDTKIFTTTIQCRGNPECIFDNQDITLDLILKNNTSSKIGLPVEYLNQKGLHCFLLDNDTGKKITLDVSLTPSSIKTQFEEVGPGESVTLSRDLNAKLIRSMRGSMVSLTATAAAAGLMKLQGDDEPVNFIEEAKIVIRGRDRFEHDNN